MKKAFPCRSVSRDDDFEIGADRELSQKMESDIPLLKQQQVALHVATSRHTNVEMGPTSEVECRSKIKELNMEVVGWYHSRTIILFF